MRKSWWAIAIAVILLLGVVIPNILSGNNRGRGYSDQVNYHARMIATFAEQWPSPDISDYPGVMTPLYHLMLAGVVHVFDAGVRALQLLASVFGPLTLIVTGCMAARTGRGLLTLTLLLPIAACMYIWDSSIWLLPDNMAWMLVAAILGMFLLAKPSAGTAMYVRLGVAGVLLAILIATRQSNIWLASLAWVYAFTQPDPDDQTLPAALGDAQRRVIPVLIAVLTTLPAFLVLAWFYKTWGGRFQPPMWDAWYARKWNPSAGAFVLALTGLLSLFFAGFWGPMFVRLLRTRTSWMILAFLGAGLVAMIGRSDYDVSMGRYGAIWNIADKFPSVGGRSLFMVGLSAIAGPIIAAWAMSLGFRARWIFVTTLAAFGATQFKNPWLYERYVDPLLLILFAMASAAIVLREDAKRYADIPAQPSFGTLGSRLESTASSVSGPVRFAGPVVLALLLGAMGLLTLRSAKDVKVLPEGDIGDPPAAKR
jgi:hypothetical protein